MNRKAWYIILGILASFALLVSAVLIMKGMVADYAGTKVTALVGKVKTVIETAKADQAYASAWVPPADSANDEAIFPTAVVGFSFTGAGADASHELFREIPGRFGIYTSGSDRIIISVYRMSELEKEAVYTRMKTHIEKLKGGTRTWSGGTNYYTYRYSFTEPTYETGAFWWSKGWLFYLRSENRVDLSPFLKTYLEEVRGKKE